MAQIDIEVLTPFATKFLEGTSLTPAERHSLEAFLASRAELLARAGDDDYLFRLAAPGPVPASTAEAPPP